MAEDPEQSHLSTLLRLTDRAERGAILQKISDEGWESGCWLRPEPDHFLRGSDEHEAILSALSDESYGGCAPSGDAFPLGLPHAPIDCAERCWLVVTQQCDLLRDFRDEPLVELAPAILDEINGARPEEGDQAAWSRERRRRLGTIRQLWQGSARFSPIDPAGSDEGVWIVDLRQRAYMPKHLLIQYPAKQALPANGEPDYLRDRFRRRLSDRYARAAVPEAYSPIIRWLQGASKKGDGNTMVREWVLVPPPDGGLAVLHAVGLTQASLDAAAFDGERWLEDTLLPSMPQDVAALIEPDVTFTAADAFPVATFDNAWRLDELEALSWRRPTTSARPTAR